MFVHGFLLCRHKFAGWLLPVANVKIRIIIWKVRISKENGLDPDLIIFSTCNVSKNHLMKLV